MPANQPPKTPDNGEERGVATKTRPKTKKPSLYRSQVMDQAKRAQHPLQCTMEKA